MQFRYWLDPVCLGGCALYALNRWVLKPAVHCSFLHSHFNDLLLIPCALPLVLWLHRRLGLRVHDRVPGGGEILLHLAIWSGLFEMVAPRFMPTTGDPLDVLAYAAGACLAWGWWRWQPSRSRSAATTPSSVRP